MPIAGLPGGDAAGALYAALVEAWHDTTCPEGADCRDRALHMLTGTGLERAAALVRHPAVQRVVAASRINLPIVSSD